MTRAARFPATLFLLLLTAVSTLASATNYTLWINGRIGNGAIGNYDSFDYWGPASTPAGVNKKAVNWDGYHSIAAQSGIVREALDCFCTGQNWCYIATHSAGDMMIGYILANYGGSTRTSKDAVPNAAGVCGAAGGTQVGWNIKWVRTAGGSAGGTELADAGAWSTSEPLVKDHKVATARAMYNHNDTHNVWFYMYAGARGTLYAWLLPGQDDEVVGYHSAGAVSGTAGGSYCNPGDWFCKDLTLGPGPNQGGWGKWNNHSVVFRDDREIVRHYTEGNWQGVSSWVRADMENFAR
jgi:hypothetical protein